MTRGSKTKLLKIALLGPYPPPYGGISVHVQRLKERLEEKGLACIVHAYSGMSRKEDGVIAIRNKAVWFFDQLFRSKDGIIHCHGYSPTALIFLSLLAAIKRKRIVITPHGFLFGPKGIGLWHRLAFWLATKTRVYFTVVGPQSRATIVSLGIKPENINKEAITSFIPPRVKEEEVAEIPQGVWDFIDSHSPIIAASAYRIIFYNNEDLYGIDLCIDLCANLKQTHPDIGFVFCLPDIGNYEYFHKMKQRVTEKNIEDNLLFVTQPCQFYPILRKCHVFVRPTNVDIYGVSVAEAIYFEVPAVASNVCPRAEGTILFQSRDVNDFTQRVKDVLDNYEWYKKRLRTIKLEDNVEKIIRVYQRLYREE